MTGADRGAPGREVRVGDMVRIGQWGRRLYRVVALVDTGVGPNRIWARLEQVGELHAWASKHALVEARRLHRADQE